MTSRILANSNVEKSKRRREWTFIMMILRNIASGGCAQKLEVTVLYVVFDWKCQNDEWSCGALKC